MMDLTCVDVACVLGWISDYMMCYLVMLANVYSGLRLLIFSSSITVCCLFYGFVCISVFVFTV